MDDGRQGQGSGGGRSLSPEGLHDVLLLAGMRPHEPIALAVSGGGDSMALALLARRWAASSSSGAGGRDHAVTAFIVDHSLRAGSREEAQKVHATLASLGMEAQVLTCHWPHGPPPANHLQSAARHARYTLMEAECVTRGIRLLLTAHHANDQAELLLMRLARCSGLAGLAGMPPVAPSPRVPRHVALVRPLLRAPKSALLQMCVDEGCDWVEDPSNASMAHARNRVRSVLATFPDAEVGDVARALGVCAQARDALSASTSRLLQTAATFSPTMGCAHVDVSALMALAPAAALHHALHSLLQMVSGRPHPARSKSVGKNGAFTVGGCHVSAMPGSSGRTALFCFSPASPPPIATELDAAGSSVASYISKAPGLAQPPVSATVDSRAHRSGGVSYISKESGLLSPPVNTTAANSEASARALTEGRALAAALGSSFPPPAGIGLVANSTGDTWQWGNRAAQQPPPAVVARGYQSLAIRFAGEQGWPQIIAGHADMAGGDEAAGGLSSPLAPRSEGGLVEGGPGVRAEVATWDHRFAVLWRRDTWHHHAGRCDSGDGGGAGTTGTLATAQCSGVTDAAAAALGAAKRLPGPVRRSLPMLFDATGLLLAIPVRAPPSTF
eukprot:jgi/Mesen1/1396/ME000013S00878